MQHIDIATVKGAKANDRKSLAILAYDNATADPDSANWRAVADILRLAIPATKAKAAEIPADSRFAPWADQEIPFSGGCKRFGKSPIIVVTFADGEIVRCPAVTLPGKPVNIGRGLRVAISFYQCRIAARHGGRSDDSAIINVPDFVSIACETTATEYDPADCNARTAELRAGSFDHIAVRGAAETFPEETEDGTTTRADYVAAAYRLAIARLRLSVLPEGEDVRPLNREIAVCEMRMEGLSNLQIMARDREADRIAAAAPPADTTPPPVAPSFKVSPRFLSSTRLTVIPGRSPVAPSRSAAVLRVA
jgi:hypothetical protein